MGWRSGEKPKVNYRKGLWSPEEDHKLRDYIRKHGLGCWSAVPAKAGLQRNGKSCRLRWINYLRPGLKRGIFSYEEEEIVINLHAKWGNKWSQIAMHLPGRTDNEVKNYWNSYLKKKVIAAEGSDAHGSASRSQDSTNQSQITNEGPSNKILSSKSLGHLDCSTLDSGQSVTLGVECHTQDKTSQNIFPKALFADWLSADHFDATNTISFNSGTSIPSDYNNLDIGNTSNIPSGYNNLNAGNTSIPSDYSNSNVSSTITKGSLPVDRQYNGGFLYGNGDGCTYGELQAQFEPMGQISGGYLEALSMGEICGGFEINGDVIF